MITFDKVSKRFADGTVAVDALSLRVPHGQITVLLGPSGCGKTTTLRMVNRLVEPSAGTITLDGRNVAGLPVHELRRGIGYVIQQAGLFPHRTVLENVVTVPGLLGWEKKRQRDRARELLDLVGLGAEVADRYPRQLSGGQQQRVGVARALAADPPVLLMDEPFGAVDPVRRGGLQQGFRQLQRELRKTVILVTHDVDEAVLLGDQIAIFRPGGQLVQAGTPQTLLANPSDAFVATFLGSSRGQQLLSLRSAGQVPAASVPAEGLMGWQLELTPDGQPKVWRAVTAGAHLPVPVQGVGPSGSLRDLLDSALTSPARAAVRLDRRGAFLGVVPWPVLSTHLLETAVAG
ncbi:ABC transporter ATP-binding protein [Kribbella sp. NPDC050820]|uniref:ABC transporter ATP-binding protein n=1 Tax=Kribbella sp. NPDC050820 TaxID=3155408 RepID=UPI0033F01C33